MRFIYNLLFLFSFLLSAPFYFFKMWRRGHWKRGFWQRFGVFDTHIKAAVSNRNSLWIHAVSVGEVNIATQLIRSLERQAPNLKILVSTTTSTGMSELRKKLPTHILKVYFPIDWPAFINRALRVVNPEAIVLIEAEIWPNFLWKAQSRRIPVFLINARMSERSFRGYRRARFIFRSIFSSFAGVGVQNEEDAQRMITLGCRARVIKQLGNLKFDPAKVEERPAFSVADIFHQIGLSTIPRVLVAGSTHEGEEAILGEIFMRLKKVFPDLFLVVVPRHFERSQGAGRDLKKAGAKLVFRTELSVHSHLNPGDIDCLVVNTTGELRYFYECATLIFIGKSLTAKGGQNPLEPAALGKAIVFGPNMQNFQAISDSLVSAGAAKQVADAAELETVMMELLTNDQARHDLGQAAVKVMSENQGAVERSVQMILKPLRKDDIYITRTERK